MREQTMVRGYATGLLMGLVTIIGCASAGFPYRYYGTQMPGNCYDQGTLQGKAGPEGWPDLSLDQCKPDPDLPPGVTGPQPVKLKCITVLIDDWYSLKADDETCHNNLKICQNGPAPQ